MYKFTYECVNRDMQNYNVKVIAVDEKEAMVKLVHLEDQVFRRVELVRKEIFRENILEEILGRDEYIKHKNHLKIIWGE